MGQQEKTHHLLPGESRMELTHQQLADHLRNFAEMVQTAEIEESGIDARRAVKTNEVTDHFIHDDFVLVVSLFCGKKAINEYKRQTGFPI